MGKEHNKIIKSIFTNNLEVKDYKKCSKNLYLKEFEGNKLVIEIQESRFDSAFFINVGLHFKGVPNFFKCEKYFCNEASELLLHKRVNSSLEYEEDLVTFERNLTVALKDSDKQLISFLTEFNDSNNFIEKFPLSLFEEVFNELSKEERNINIIRKLSEINDFSIGSNTVLSYSLGYLFLEKGDKDNALKFFEEGLRWSNLDGWDPIPLKLAIDSIT